MLRLRTSGVITNQALSNLCNSYNLEGPAQVGISYSCGQLYMRVQGSSVEIQTATHWNLIGHSMTIQKAVLSLSSSLLPPMSCAFISTRKNSVHSSKTLFQFFVLLLKLFKSEIVQVEIAQVWESVHCVHGMDRDNFIFTL